MKWRISGAFAKDGREVAMSIDAPARDEAESWAAANGILWTDITAEVPVLDYGGGQARAAVLPVLPDAPAPLEKQYYRDEEVLITATRVVIGSATYTLANITSVQSATNYPNALSFLGVVLAGLLIAITGLNVAWPCGFIGLVFIGGGIYSLITVAATFAVRIGSASGESNVLSCRDEQRVDQIVAAINLAIVDRG
jgi:hypothetical protein